jgi:hypothetical protein
MEIIQKEVKSMYFRNVFKRIEFQALISIDYWEGRTRHTSGAQELQVL